MTTSQEPTAPDAAGTEPLFPAASAPRTTAAAAKAGPVVTLDGTTNNAKLAERTDDGTLYAETPSPTTSASASPSRPTPRSASRAN